MYFPNFLWETWFSFVITRPNSFHLLKMEGGPVKLLSPHTLGMHQGRAGQPGHTASSLGGDSCSALSHWDQVGVGWRALFPESPSVPCLSPAGSGLSGKAELTAPAMRPWSVAPGLGVRAFKDSTDCVISKAPSCADACAHLPQPCRG